MPALLEELYQVGWPGEHLFPCPPLLGMTGRSSRACRNSHIVQLNVAVTRCVDVFVVAQQRCTKEPTGHTRREKGVWNLNVCPDIE